MALRRAGVASFEPVLRLAARPRLLCAVATRSISSTPWRLAADGPATAKSPAAAAAAADAGGAAGKSTHKPGAHFRVQNLKIAYPSATGGEFMPHPVYSEEDVHAVTVEHIPPTKTAEKAAFYLMKFARTAFDTVSGYGEHMTVDKWMTRLLFLETVAGVPPMVAGMARHLTSLRSMRRDRGWIHTLLEEAENERMHLMTFMELRQPGLFFRLSVLFAQGLLFNSYFITYLVAPSYCHKFVGYLEEEAVRTYTHLVKDLDAGKLPEWSALPASALAKTYWQLPEDAMFRDVLLAIRADEAVHRDVNHTLSSLPSDAPCPFH